jgi:Kdo2-lipid IVA lauroyltransferase/acyltransferase
MTAQTDGRASKPARTVTLRHRLEYVLYLLVRGVARIVGEPGLALFGSFVAFAASRLVRRRTDLAMRNLAMVYPDKSVEERARIVHDCWRHYAIESIRYIRDSGVRFEEISTRFDLVGTEHMERALSAGKGVILTSAHFGSWENALSVLGQFGRKIVVVGRVLDNPLLHSRLQEGRTRSGFELLDRRAAARELIRALQEKSIVVLLVDQAVREHEGSIVPFLGHDAWTTTSHARLAKKYGCPMLSCFCYPASGGGRERVEFSPVFEIDRLDDVAITRLVNDEIGRHIDRDPHLWLWFHDRWKSVDRAT